ncbi:MAG: GNAT family N-acetyltransferase [Clostridia bacterium]|nr:GNAT family N-acetyltransferase [Clostridia bacterium]
MKTLVTRRLVLDDPRLSDAEDFYDYARNPLVGPYAGWAAHRSVNESERTLRALIRSGEVWSVRLRDDYKMIGTIGLHKDCYRNLDKGLSYELGFSLSADYHGMGIMPEAAKAVLEYAFEILDAKIVSVSHFDFNLKSQRVIEKLGFTYEGRIRQARERLDTGELSDVIVYSMLKDEYFQNKN